MKKPHSGGSSPPCTPAPPLVPILLLPPLLLSMLRPLVLSSVRDQSAHHSSQDDITLAMLFTKLSASETSCEGARQSDSETSL